jgi:hypothetical protein
VLSGQLAQCILFLNCGLSVRLESICSRAQRPRRRAGQLFQVAGHVGLIGKSQICGDPCQRFHCGLDGPPCLPLSLFINEALPHSWCKSTPPNARKQLKRFGIERPFQKVARRLHSRPCRPNIIGLESMTWSPSSRIKLAPRVRKNLIKEKRQRC